MLPIEQLTGRYEIRRFTEADLPALLEFCLGNPLYYEHLRSQPTLESLREELTVRPKGKDLEDKYFVGLYRGGALAVLLELIDGHPRPDVAYIGWFMMAKARQGRGEGSAIIGELLDFLKEHGFHAVRLACVKGNPQSARFWAKNGFVPDGVESQWENCTVVELERML